MMRRVRMGFGVGLAAVAITASAQLAWSTAPDVVDYSIEVSLDPTSHSLQGSEVVRWSNATSVPADEIWIHLYLNAFAGSETTFMRELGSGSLRGRVSQTGEWGWTTIDSLLLDDGTDLLPEMEFMRPDDGNIDDFTVVRVPLPEAVRPGSSVELEIGFSARLPWIIARTGFVDDFFLIGQWFPKIAVFEGERGWNSHQFHASSEFFADFGSYHVTMEVPEGWVVGASGYEIERTPLDGRERIVYRAERVHDFAWCAAPPSLMEVFETDFEPARDVPPRWLAQARPLLGLSAAELELPPMRLRLILPRAQHALIPRMVRALRLAVAWYGLYYGPYPYPQLTVVSPPSGAEEAGGMEYPTFITTGAGNLDAYAPFAWSPGIEAVTVHEFGHQYFQGLLASNEFEQAWLDEGLNTYAEVSCMTAIADEDLAPDFLHLVSFWGQQRLAIGAASLPVTIDRPAWTYRQRWRYFLASYSKTGVAMRTIQGLIGPEAMARGLRALGWFFDQAIRSDATPDWAVLSVRQRHAGDATGMRWEGASWREIEAPEDDGDEPPAAQDELWTIDVDLARRGDLVGPVTVELTWEDGSTERRQWDGAARWERWRLEDARRLEQVVIDPEVAWALETRRADNYWRQSPARPRDPLWWLRDALLNAGQLFLKWGF
ncbi:MAG: M1 family metallopeptidase [Acidobacteriota bacterium]